MTNHKSHHIFIYLGILIAIFILFFGFNYFKSVYNFNEAKVVVSDQNYDAGALTESPFVPVEEEVVEVDSFVNQQENKITKILPDNYISGQTNWPPIITENNEAYFCNIGTSEGERPTVTSEEIIGDKTFCVERSGDGATGSFYSSQKYKTKTTTGIKQTSFTLRFNKCDFFEDPERSECEKINSDFDINSIISSLDW